MSPYPRSFVYYQTLQFPVTACNMARTKAKGTALVTPTSAQPAASSARRPFNALFLLAFLALAAAFIWLMRVDTVLNDVPVDFLLTVESGRFGNGTPLESRFTGIGVVDDAAKFLVAAFLSGTAGWDAGARLQQVYFLMNWFAVVCVWVVEASRRRNAGKLLSWYVVRLSHSFSLFSLYLSPSRFSISVGPC